MRPESIKFLKFFLVIFKRSCTSLHLQPEEGKELCTVTRASSVLAATGGTPVSFQHLSHSCSSLLHSPSKSASKYNCLSRWVVNTELEIMSDN